MANESENGQEKTEQPTPKKLRDAKQKGQVPRSKELNSMTVTVFGALGLLFLGAHMIGQVSQIMVQGFNLSRDQVMSTPAVFVKFDQAVATAPWNYAPDTY